MTEGQKAVYAVLKLYGPLADHALVPLAQHMAGIRMSSSGICARRKELVDAGKAQSVGETKTGTGRKAVVYEAI